MKQLLSAAECQKLLKKLQTQYETILQEENNSSTFLCSTIEDPESLRPKYSYEDTKKALKDTFDQILKIRHAINIFNSTTTIPEIGLTIDELLILMPAISSKINKLNHMSKLLPKQRSGSNPGGNIIDYVLINYDLDTVKHDLEEARDYLSKAQLALDVINHEKLIELDI